MAIDDTQFSALKLAANTQWLSKRFEWDTLFNPVYRGCHRDFNASTGDTNWYIWKFTWSSATLEKIQGPLVGSWEGRAALPW